MCKIRGGEESSRQQDPSWVTRLMVFENVEVERGSLIELKLCWRDNYSPVLLTRITRDVVTNVD